MPEDEQATHLDNVQADSVKPPNSLHSVRKRLHRAIDHLKEATQEAATRLEQYEAIWSSEVSKVALEGEAEVRRKVELTRQEAERAHLLAVEELKESLRKEYENKLSDQEIVHAKQLKQVGRQNQEYIKSIQQKHNEFTEQLIQCHNQQLQLLQNEHEETLASKQRQHKQQLDNLERLVDVLTVQSEQNDMERKQIQKFLEEAVERQKLQELQWNAMFAIAIEHERISSQLTISCAVKHAVDAARADDTRQHNADLQELKGQLLKEHNSKVQDIEDANEALVGKLTKQHQDHIESLRTQHSAFMQQLTDQHAWQISALQRQHEDVFAHKEEQTQLQLSELQAFVEAQKAQIMQLSTTKAELEQALQDCQEQYHNQLRALVAQHAQNITEVQLHYQSVLNAQVQEQLSSVHRKHSLEISSLRDEYQEYRLLVCQMLQGTASKEMLTTVNWHAGS